MAVVKQKPWLLALLTLLVILAAGAAFFLFPNASEESRSTKENLGAKENPSIKENRRKLSSLSHSLATRCLGFYVVDLPDTITEQDMSASFDLNRRAWVQSKLIGEADFDDELVKRRQILQKISPTNPMDGNFLKQEFPLHEGMKGIIFERMEDKKIPDASRLLEAIYWQDGVGFDILMQAQMSTFSHLRSNSTRRQQTPENLPRLYQLLDDLEARHNLDIPIQVGICLPHGILTGNSSKDFYQIKQEYQNSRLENISLTIETSNGLSTKKSLLEYTDSETVEEKGILLKKGRRMIKTLPVEETIIKGPIMAGDNFGYRFRLSIYSKTSTRKTPKFEMVMTYRVPDMVSYGMSHGLSEERAAQIRPNEVTLSEAEVMALWQKVTDSIHLRENFMPK